MLSSIPWAQTLLTLLSILDTHPIATIFTILLIILALALLIDHYLAPREIPHIFSIPGELPFIGHLHLILDNPALIYLTWCKLYNAPVFQIRIGNKRVVVVNAFNDVVALWVNHSCQNNSRPLSYTFHGLVSAFQGFTVGSTPASATFSRKKKTISSCLRKREVEGKVDLIDEEICCMVKEMVRRKDIGNVDVNFLPYLQKFTLKTAIKMSYGISLDCYNKDAKLCQEIIDVESNIIRLRSPISNLQDSVPFLRFIPWFNNREFAIRCGNRRNKYMDQLHKTLLDGITDNDPAMTNSILGKLILSNNDTTKLTPQEIQSICLTLVSAGLDNTPLNLNYLFGILSQPRLGKHIQDKAIHEILSHSPHGDLVAAWNQANDESRDCKYVHALVLETLRHFTVLPLSLPRSTTKPIYYKDFMIPRDTHLFMNAYAANHDETVFVNPFRFDPERWIDKETNEIRSQGTFPVGVNHLGGSGGGRGTGNVQNFHFAFGAGSRMCSGYNLVMKEMYMMVIKMLLLFEVMPPGDGSSGGDGKRLMELNPFANNSNPRGTSFEPGVNYIRLKFRKLPGYEALHDIVLR